MRINKQGYLETKKGNKKFKETTHWKNTWLVKHKYGTKTQSGYIYLQKDHVSVDKIHIGKRIKIKIEEE